METNSGSASSGLTTTSTLMEPKVEEPEYDWSQYTSFEVNLDDYLDEDSSCKSQHCNYSLWNCNVFQDVEPPDLSNVLGEAYTAFST